MYYNLLKDCPTCYVRVKVRAKVDITEGVFDCEENIQLTVHVQIRNYVSKIIQLVRVYYTYW